jgi:hypothetical protein
MDTTSRSAKLCVTFRVTARSVRLKQKDNVARVLLPLRSARIDRNHRDFCSERAERGRPDKIPPVEHSDASGRGRI